MAFSESARRPSVVALRVSVVGVAIRAPVVATTAPLGLSIIATAAPLGLTTIVTVGVFPTVAGFRIPRDLVLAARGHARQDNFGVLQANLLHKREKRRGILGRDPHTTMRGGPAEISHLKAAVDRIAIL